MPLKYISPRTLSEFVNFYRDPDKKNWLYGETNETSMQVKQAEGASFLFNLLIEKEIALLADEVGMGKTIQALAVMAALWRQKPEAKILVLAPRAEIALNWINEYETFINVHYKLNDDIIRSSIGNVPINMPVYCKNLFDLVENVQQGWGRLFIGKISSFSHLLINTHSNEKDKTKRKLDALGIVPSIDYDDEGIDVLVRTRALADQLRSEITSTYGKNGNPPFDLLIIDEAHYFRNIRGDSLRVNSARSFFGEGSIKIAKSVLLLTATPNHTSSEDIKNIVSYFDEGLIKNTYQSILNDIGLRRFRRLSQKGWMKYNYRDEKAVKADFENDIISELFFGLYQKQVAKNYLEDKENRRSGNMLSYLEGTEFIPTAEAASADDTDQLKGQDYSQGADGQLLIQLSKDYYRIFKEYPSHPKYNKLIEEIIPPEFTANKLNKKSLVFVRRIPSVREIAKRAIQRYDEIFIEKLSALTKRPFNKEDIEDRRKFNNKINKVLREKVIEEDVPDAELDGDQNEEERNVLVPSSLALNLFKPLRKDPKSVTSTHASNFRIRFSKSKPSIFAIFFAPTANYLCDPENANFAYKLQNIIQTNEGSKGYIDNYYITFLLHRTNFVDRADKSSILNSLGGEKIKDKREVVGFKKETTIDTLFTIYWKYVDQTERISESDKSSLCKVYSTFDHYQKEALSRFIEKGVLLASTALFDLFFAYLKIRKRKNYQALELYQKFTKELENSFDELPLFEIITESIINFSILCEKVFNLKSKKDIINEEWKDFFDAQPAYAYSGDTKNKRVLQSFNTPFLPDILISTSVLQEGVNLQYFCDQIIHYGIAWTPGDNEQRVGRIDRMFSKVEKNIELSDKARLHIIYPYLRNTIDQDHLVNFIYKKHYEENLIDHCQSSSSQVKLDHADLNMENWFEYLRKPDIKSIESEDPYPARLLGTSELTSVYVVREIKEKIDIISKVINTFLDAKKKVYQTSQGKKGQTNPQICIVEEIFDNNRTQPVFIELNYSPLLSGLKKETIYVLSMRTPLGTKKVVNKIDRAYSKFRDLYENQLLTVKLCLDQNQSSSSRFGVYMKVELPIFIQRTDNPLSKDEVLTSFNALAKCADIVEERTFPNQDISIDELSLKKMGLDHLENKEKLRGENKSTRLNEGWKIQNEYVFLERIINQKIDFKDILIKNHNTVFCKYFIYKNQCNCILPFIACDIQSLEEILFERLFKYYQEWGGAN